MDLAKERSVFYTYRHRTLIKTVTGESECKTLIKTFLNSRIDEVFTSFGNR